MSFISCYETNNIILMEGALGERLKREYDIAFDDTVALANIIYRKDGKSALLSLWKEYISIASKYNLPFIVTTPTRRANKERVFSAGYNDKIIADNVAVLRELKENSNIQMYIGGLMGCYGDAYKATDVLTVKKAKDFHSWQANLFAQNNVDFLYAGIMPALSEAVGMAISMEQTKRPYIISFMIREDGNLIDGTTINDAIFEIDKSVQRKPVCYMTNCVHPTVLYKALSNEKNKTRLVKERFHGIQANTSALSPEELDNSHELKCSNCIDLAEKMLSLRKLINLKIIGGCCGTDNSHMEAIANLFR